MANSQFVFYQCNTKFDSNVSVTYCHILLRVLLRRLGQVEMLLQDFASGGTGSDANGAFVAGRMFSLLVYMQCGVERRRRASVESSRNAMKKAVFD